MPGNTIYVGRPGPWGNPFDWQDEINPHFGDGVAKAACKSRFENWFKGDLEGAGNWLKCDFDPESLERLEERRQWMLAHIHELRKKNLACWCKRGQPCHADVLLEMANSLWYQALWRPRKLIA